MYPVSPGSGVGEDDVAIMVFIKAFKLPCRKIRKSIRIISASSCRSEKGNEAARSHLRSHMSHLLGTSCPSG